MKYAKTVTGTFVSRPNRFVAYCEIDGKVEKVHVKNTGRCKELLIPGAKTVLEVSCNPNRSTGYDLIAVYKGDRLVNIDSQAPNAAVRESFGRICAYDFLRPEFFCGESRFDFYAERGGKKILAEVKGVTKETDNVAMFPDAPTERGLKHVLELTRLANEGYECYVILVVQMEKPDYFIPDYPVHREFGEALAHAKKCGVNVLAFDCVVKEESMDLNNPVEVRF